MLNNLLGGLSVLVLRVLSVLVRILAAALIGFALIWAVIGAFASGWSGVIKSAYIPAFWACVMWGIHVVATAIIGKLCGSHSHESQPPVINNSSFQPMATHSYLKIYPDGHIEQITIGTTAYGRNEYPPAGHRTETIIEHVKN
jgi:hypothetical protein